MTYLQYLLREKARESSWLTTESDLYYQIQTVHTVLHEIYYNILCVTLCCREVFLNVGQWKWLILSEAMAESYLSSANVA